MKKNLPFLLFTFLLWVQTDVVAQCFKLNASEFRGYTGWSRKTGINEIDEKFYDEKESLEKFFGLRIDLWIVQESEGIDANAQPHPDGSYAFDGLVRFGVNMLKKQLWESNKGEWAVTGVLAHEVGHVYQFKKNCPLLKEKSAYRSELQADFLAGYYLNRGEFLNKDEMAEFAESLFEIGDKYFWEKDHHGTPKQRAAMLLHGYFSKSASVEDAYQESFKILNQKGFELGGTPNFDFVYEATKTQKPITPDSQKKEKNLDAQKKEKKFGFLNPKIPRGSNSFYDDLITGGVKENLKMVFVSTFAKLPHIKICANLNYGSDAEAIGRSMTLGGEVRVSPAKNGGFYFGIGHDFSLKNVTDVNKNYIQIVAPNFSGSEPSAKYKRPFIKVGYDNYIGDNFYFNIFFEKSYYSISSKPQLNQTPTIDWPGFSEVKQTIASLGLSIGFLLPENF